MEYRNALIIAYYFPPMGLSGVQRIAKFAKYLPEYGWNPLILTSSGSGYYAYDDSLEREIREKNIQVFRTTEKSKPIRRKIKFPGALAQKAVRAVSQSIFQPDRMITWKNQAVRRGQRIIDKNNIEAIFATAPPFTDFLVAKELSEKNGIPFIVDYRDVWIDNPFHFYATAFHKKYSQKLEAGILNRAAKIIVTARNTKELMLKRYPFVSFNDVLIIPHGFDPEDFRMYKSSAPDKKFFTITHSGLFQDNRNPKYFFQAMANFLKNNPKAKEKFRAKFVGIMRKKHLKYIKKFKLTENCILEGFLEHIRVVKHLKEADVLWLYLNDTVRSPGKLFEYIGAEKPILICSPEGEMRKIALDTKAAIATGPDDVKSIEHALEALYKLWESGNLPKPDKYYVEKFNREKLTGGLARELSLAAEI